MADRTLGDVPGIDDLLPDSNRVLPAAYTYNEVNPLGEVTAGLESIGGAGSSDPFAYDIGFMDQGDGTEAGGYVTGNDPMADVHMGSGYSTGAVSAYGSNDTNSQWSAEQLENAGIISKVGKRLGASDRDVQVAIMAAIVESNLQNLDYGDADSIGMFQQRDAWGSREDRLDPAKAAEMFFTGGGAGQQGLRDIPNTARDSRPMGDLAQDVQVSAFPDRYAEHEQDAAGILASLSGDTIHGGKGEQYGLVEIDGETVDRMTAAALKATEKTWGGSGINIMQGSHSTDVAASGSTHAGGGVIDIAPTDGDWVGLLTALRKVGFAAWIRNMPGYGQAGSGAHIHAVLIGNEELDPQAELQVQSYLNNDDGLTGSRPDDGPREYVNNRFVWGKDPAKENEPTWRDTVTKTARAFLGAPFKWGGEGPDGVDTEGLVRGIYSKVGVNLPPMGQDYRRLADPIDVTDAKPGDLIGWEDQYGHLQYGIYLKNGRLIEAGGPDRVVQMNELGDSLLNAFGIPIEQLLGRPTATSPLGGQNGAPPAVSTYANPGSVTTTTSPTGSSMVEPHANITSHPDPTGGQVAGQGALNPDKPHTPMP